MSHVAFSCISKILSSLERHLEDIEKLPLSEDQKTILCREANLIADELVSLSGDITELLS